MSNIEDFERNMRQIAYALEDLDREEWRPPPCMGRNCYTECHRCKIE